MIKLIKRLQKGALFPVIDMSYTQEMTDSIHGTIAYSGIEREIIGTPFFNRLHRILQSSLVYLTYPSNKVKRFEHSIGTMHLAGKFFFQCICNSSKESVTEFFNEVNAELTAWNKKVTHSEIFYIHQAVQQRYRKDAILRAPYPLGKLYRENTPSDLQPEFRFAYYVVYQSIRLAGLLHDVGHLPYSHILEHSLQRLFRRVNQIPVEERNNAQKHFLSIMEKYCSSESVAIHEELGKLFVKKIFESLIADLPKNEQVEYYFLAAVIYFTQEILNSEDGENTIFSDLHHIIAGTVDCDRMDYCCRDAYAAGVSKELPDYDRILSTVSIVYRKVEQPIVYDDVSVPEERKRCYFAPSTKALNQVEALLRKRWNIFETINFHHRVHKHELLLEGILADLGFEEMRSSEPPEELENILPLRVSSIWQLVAQINTPTPIEYIALQLDDSWLDTLLKAKFFEAYGETYLSINTNGKDIKWHRLDELISSKKHYHSLIKRSGGFRRFDECLYRAFFKNAAENGLGDLKEDYAQYVSGQGEYLFNRALRQFAPDSQLRRQFFEEFDAGIQALIQEKGNEFRIMDCFLGDCTFNVGLRQVDPFYITSPEQDEKPFVHYSALYDALVSKKKLQPSFHIYYLPEYDSQHSEYYKPKAPEFQAAVAEVAFDLFMKWFQKMQNNGK